MNIIDPNKSFKTTAGSFSLVQLVTAPMDRIADLVHDNAKEKGFHRKHEFNDEDYLNYQLMNLIREVTELHEAWRNGHFHKLCDKADKMVTMGLPPLTYAEEEYADIIIRALDQARRLKIDIVRAIAVKHLYNTTRPQMHGGKLS